MKIIILCEGKYDLRILGYYIHKISGMKWAHCNDARRRSAAKRVKIPGEIFKDAEFYEAFGKEGVLVLWPVGGKDRFQHAIKDIYRINTVYPEESFDKVIMIADRDDADIVCKLKEFDQMFENVGWKNTCLQNNACNHYSYKTEDGERSTHRVDIIPIIIPYNERGAMETILIESISKGNQENKLVTSKAIKYIDDVDACKEITSYLTRSSQRVKAKYSAVIAVMNPDHGSDTYDKLLMTYAWEQSDVFEEHFGILKRVL